MIPKQIIQKIHYDKIFIDFFLKKKFNNHNKLFSYLSNIFGVKKKLIFLGRARTGIFLAIKILLNEQKPKVLMSSFTIPDVVNMVICAGGIPVFLDFDKNTTFLNILELKKIIKKKDCSVLILTHYNINDINYKKIYEICKKNKIKLIEDCAISIGGRANNYKIGSLSDSTIYSFSSFKFINFFYGGLIHFKKKIYFENAKKITRKWKKLKFLNYFEPLSKAIKFQIITSKAIYYFLVKIFYLGFIKKNSIEKKNIKFYLNKMDSSYYSLPAEPFFFEFERKILNFKKYQNHRRKISSIYLKFLKPISIPHNLSQELIDNSSCYSYLIKVKNKNKLRKKLADLGYDTGYAMYPNCHKYKNYQSFEGNSKNVDDLIKHCISLPTHQYITSDYAKKISIAVISNLNVK
jgi:perosamine synthetase